MTFSHVLLGVELALVFISILGVIYDLSRYYRSTRAVVPSV